MNSSTFSFSLEYREYILPDEFPVLVLAPKNPVFLSNFSSPERKYHFHNCIEIGICHEGEHTLLFENNEYLISPGTFFVLSPYTMHFMNRNDRTTPASCEYLYIKPEELLQGFYPFQIPSEMMWYKNATMPFIFSKEKHSVIYGIIESILREYKEHHINYKLVVKGLFLSLMAELTREVSVSNCEQRPSKYQSMSKIQPALQHIHQNYTQPLKIAELATICHMSTSGFCTLFSDLMHNSPNRYINTLRLENACELLRSTELPVLDISIETGFSSLSNFYKMFKERYNMSPSKWRNEKRVIRKKNYRYSPFLPEA